MKLQNSRSRMNILAASFSVRRTAVWDKLPPNSGSSLHTWCVGLEKIDHLHGMAFLAGVVFGGGVCFGNSLFVRYATYLSVWQELLNQKKQTGGQSLNGPKNPYQRASCVYPLATPGIPGTDHPLFSFSHRRRGSEEKLQPIDHSPSFSGPVENTQQLEYLSVDPSLYTTDSPGRFGCGLPATCRSARAARRAPLGS